MLLVADSLNLLQVESLLLEDPLPLLLLLPRYLLNLEDPQLLTERQLAGLIFNHDLDRWRWWLGLLLGVFDLGN